jgi:hypothetical protein
MTGSTTGQAVIGLVLVVIAAVFGICVGGIIYAVGFICRCGTYNSSASAGIVLFARRKSERKTCKGYQYYCFYRFHGFGFKFNNTVVKYCAIRPYGM